MDLLWIRRSRFISIYANTKRFDINQVVVHMFDFSVDINRYNNSVIFSSVDQIERYATSCRKIKSIDKRYLTFVEKYSIEWVFRGKHDWSLIA